MTTLWAKMLRLTLNRQDLKNLLSEKLLNSMVWDPDLDPEQEPEPKPKLFRSRNRNRNIVFAISNDSK